MIELEIIEECRKGNLRDFKTLVERASPFAFSVAFRMLGDDEQAKDVVQDTMITIWKQIQKIRSAESFQTWLYRIVVNKCYDLMRKRKVNPELRIDEKGWELISDRVSGNPSADIENSELAGIIRALTEKLSPKQKAVFILADLEEIPQNEISRITGMSSANVKANLHYARKKIGEMIEKHL